MLEYTGYSVDKIVKDICGREINLEEIEKLYGSKVRKRVEILNEYWSKVESGEVREPILPIFGGMPSVGKTTTSSYVARTLGINIVIGGDGFRAVLRALIDKEKNPAFFVSVYKAWELFGEFSKENVIKGFEAQAKILNEAIERLIVDRGIRDGEPMSIDFLHFLPSLWHKETLEHPSVMPFILYVEDEERWKSYIKERVKRNHLKGGWKRLIEALESYKIMRDYQLEDAKKHGIPVVAMDDVEKAKEEILEIISNKVKKLMEIKTWDKEHPLIHSIKKERKE